MRKVNKQLEVPLYIQLAHIIQEMIDLGELLEEACLMSERDICEVQEISRMTVNKAIEKLVHEGLLIRHQGKGTFVAKKRQTSRYQGLESLSEMMAKKGLVVSNKLLSFEAITLSKWVQKKLKTEATCGYKIKRVRYVENEPLILESIYLNKGLCPDLTRTLVEAHSMYHLYSARYHHQFARAEQIVRPTLLNELQAKQLGQSEGDLALSIRRHLYTEKEEVMEYTESIFLSSKHDFEMVLTRSK